MARGQWLNPTHPLREREGSLDYYEGGGWRLSPLSSKRVGEGGGGSVSPCPCSPPSPQEAAAGGEPQPPPHNPLGM